jgi:hypothetical protein
MRMLHSEYVCTSSGRLGQVHSCFNSPRPRPVLTAEAFLSPPLLPALEIMITGLRRTKKTGRFVLHYMVITSHSKWLQSVRHRHNAQTYRELRIILSARNVASASVALSSLCSEQWLPMTSMLPVRDSLPQSHMKLHPESAQITKG